jgi:hypothetical protein
LEHETETKGQDKRSKTRGGSQCAILTLEIINPCIADSSVY